MVTNDIIRHYFGDLKADRIKDEFGKWSDDYAKTSNGIWLMARGAGAQIRGVKAVNIPPTLEIIDDPQGLRSILTKESLDKADNWFENEVMFARAKKWKRNGKLVEGKVRILGTIVHRDCLVQRKRKDSRFNTVFMQAIETNKRGEEDSIWPEMYPLDDLLQEKEEYARNGKLKVWMQERMNIPMSDEDKPFNVENLRYWDDVSGGGLSYFDVINGVPAVVFERGNCKGLTDGFTKV